MFVTYDTGTGKIKSACSIEQSVEAYNPNELPDITQIYIENFPEDAKNNINYYKIVNNELIRLTEEEIQELMMYGKFLTEEEKQLQKLKPSIEEVKKAEQTIEILTLIQEVI